MIRKAGDEIADEPGFFEVDTVAYCGSTLKGVFARTLTDVFTGWVHQVIPNNAMKHITAGLARAKEEIPFLIQAMDFDNGSEFINHDR